MRKINNRWLIGLFILLAGLFVLARIFRAPALESNLRKEISSFDTAAVTELRIKKPGADELNIKRSGKSWNVSQGTKTAPADGGVVKATLASLNQLKPMRLVSRKKDKWADFQVNEAGTAVLAFQNTRQVADLRIGKTNFTQSPQGGFGGAYTYVRPGDEDAVYAVDGFLESYVGRPFADWRNKTFLRVNRAAVTKISFVYPADSSFVLEKKDTVWTVGGAPAHRGNVDAYLNHLSFKNLSAFADDFQPPGPAPVTIKIETAGGPLETVEAWPRTATPWVLKSMAQPAYFSSEGSSAATDLFKGKSYFLRP